MRLYGSRSALLGAFALTVGAMLAGCSGDNSASLAAPTLQVVSSRAEHVSGGTALIDISAAGTGIGASVLSVTVNGTDVSAAFKPDPTQAGHLISVVTQLQSGANTVVASNGGATASLTLTSHPISGPIVSGPHQTPFVCQTANFVMPDGSFFGTATDADCSAPARVIYMYLPTGATALIALPSTTALPANVASTTTVAGATVPFVVRIETTTVNRGIYQSAVLHDPTTEAAPTPVLPPKGWNRRLVAVEGFSCAGSGSLQGGAQGRLANAGIHFSVQFVDRLGQGYAMFANTLQHASNHCDVRLASEAVMMSKEYFVKQNGVPALTVSAARAARMAAPNPPTACPAYSTPS